MLNICNECEIRESSAGFIHSLALGISYLKGKESHLSDKIMIGSLIKTVSSIQEKHRVGNSFSLQITGFYVFPFLFRNNTPQCMQCYTGAVIKSQSLKLGLCSPRTPFAAQVTQQVLQVQDWQENPVKVFFPCGGL